MRKGGKLMGIQAQNLTIIFRSIQPEQLYQGIQRRTMHLSGRDDFSSSYINEDLFQSLAHAEYPSYSHEEIGNIFGILQEQMKSPRAEIVDDASVFYLLVRMGQRVLRWHGRTPSCRFSEMFSWRNTYQNLGQDIVTTAYIAYEDLHRGAFDRCEFDWAPVLKTDNSRLNRLLECGLAENHCHLGGTTQNFPVSWACLMNHVEEIEALPKWLKINLQPHMSRGIGSNVWSWKERLMWAAWIRIKLFSLLQSIEEEKCCGSSARRSYCRKNNNLNFDLEQNFYPTAQLKRMIMTARFQYGMRAKYSGGKSDVLDYALRENDCKNGMFESMNRLLSGERSFLYRCFQACFCGEFDKVIQDWFYMYLLIKENFRAEIVQVNRQVGFYNFLEYQNRKDVIFEDYPVYQAEAIRLSINANQNNQAIRSFEVRLKPKDSPRELEAQIHLNEAYIKDADGLKDDCQVFYVYHFIKEPDNGPFRLGTPRNSKVRQSCRIKASALAYGVRHNQYLNDNIFGIDAANLEIGCRPEVFATEFRYLQDLSPNRSRLSNQGLIYPHIFATYHAGEDFLDIADGLRAIDEAVNFLCLDRGSRIGHALALGVDPDLHYAHKRYRIILSKQDLLDNLVWLNFRSHELNIHMDEEQQGILLDKAEELFVEIYHPVLQSIRGYHGLHEYYCSMQLRGDEPELYFTLPVKDQEPFAINSRDAYRLCPNEKLKKYRTIDTIGQLYQAYHYDKGVRERGRESEAFVIKPAYINLIRSMQEKLAEQLCIKGIMIECNPTSNYLIGTFGRYDQHPIMRFNSAGLVRLDGQCIPSFNLSVSINTDDLGVFDTTLENEYAMLAAALSNVRENGKGIYTTDSIYQYLENIRQMGLVQSFFLQENRIEPADGGHPMIESGWTKQITSFI